MNIQGIRPALFPSKATAASVGKKSRWMKVNKAETAGVSSVIAATSSAVKSNDHAKTKGMELTSLLLFFNSTYYICKLTWTDMSSKWSYTDVCCTVHHQPEETGGLSSFFSPPSTACPPCRGQNKGSAMEQRPRSLEGLRLKDTSRGHALGEWGRWRGEHRDHSGGGTVNPPCSQFDSKTLLQIGLRFFFFLT